MNEVGIFILVLAIGVMVGAVVMWVFVSRINSGYQRKVTIENPPSVSKAVQNEEFVDGMPETQFLPEYGLAIQIITPNQNREEIPDPVFSKGQPIFDHLALDHIMNGLPNIRSALKGGNVVRVTGTKKILEGLKNGNFHRLADTGTVADQSGKIVGNLRLGDLKSVRRVVGPLAIYQIASAITCQYYLNQISSKMDEIRGGIENLEQYVKGEHLGQIKHAEVILKRTENLELQGISPGDEIDLSNVERDLRTLLHNRLESLKVFGEKIQKRLKKEEDNRKLKEIKVKEINRLLEEARGNPREDIYLACYALQLLVQTLLRRLWIESVRHPESKSIRSFHFEQSLNSIRMEIQRVTSNLEPIMTELVLDSRFDQFKKKILRRKVQTKTEKLEEMRKSFQPFYEMLGEIFPCHKQEIQVIQLLEDKSSHALKGFHLLPKTTTSEPIKN